MKPMIFFLELILTIGCLQIAYSNQQINIILNFVSICLVLFLTFFSINDIYLVSFFIAIIYSGGLVISFMFVIMILDVNISSTTMTFIWFIIFINQQVYNSFTFLLFSLSHTFLITTRKVSLYQKDIILIIIAISYNIVYELLLIYFLYLHW